MIQGLDVAAVSDPCFTPIEEGDEADSLTYNKLGVEVKVAVDKNSASQLRKGSCCLPNLVLDLKVIAPILSKDTTKIFEGGGYCQWLMVDDEDRQGV